MARIGRRFPVQPLIPKSQPPVTRTAAEIIPFSDFATFAIPAAGDSLAVSDSVTTATTFTRSAAESVALADSARVTALHTHLSAQDPVGISDSVSFGFSLADSLTFADQTNIGASLHVQDMLTFQDAASVFGLGLDSISFSDLVDVRMRSSDSISIGDSARLAQIVSELIPFADAVTEVLSRVIAPMGIQSIAQFGATRIYGYISLQGLGIPPTGAPTDPNRFSPLSGSPNFWSNQDYIFVTLTGTVRPVGIRSGEEWVGSTSSCPNFGGLTVIQENRIEVCSFGKVVFGDTQVIGHRVITAGGLASVEVLGEPTLTQIRYGQLWPSGRRPLRPRQGQLWPRQSVGAPA